MENAGLSIRLLVFRRVAADAQLVAVLQKTEIGRGLLPSIYSAMVRLHLYAEDLLLVSKLF